MATREKYVKKGRFRSAGAALMLVLFALYYCGSTLFVHTHRTWRGVETHSHPYLPSASHNHSDAEFSLISMLNTILAEPAADADVPQPGDGPEAILLIMPEAAGAVACVATAEGRAPPFIA
ncbi:MAG: hypothetical protein K2F72_02425 [Muribaculaceae bacterium]|nr:hypothetical protein [Muribaculaceae bacterium]